MPRDVDPKAPGQGPDGDQLALVVHRCGRTLS